MTLSEVLAGVPVLSELPPKLAYTEVKGLEYDSRRVQPGYLFFAFPGARWMAASSPPTPSPAEPLPSSASKPAEASLPGWIQVEHGRQALALAARTFYGKLDEKLGLTGITGTNGKTTTSYLIDSILRAAGKTTALIGTIEYHLPDRASCRPPTPPPNRSISAGSSPSWTRWAEPTPPWRFRPTRWRSAASTDSNSTPRYLPI